MKKTFVTVACAVVVASAISVAAGNTRLGVFGVDAVSAATTEAPAPAPTPAPAPAPKATAKPAAVPRTTTTRSAAVQSATYATGTDITSVLALGSNGSDVKLLQTLLNNNGYSLTVDGFFGSLTEAAVKDYQGKNGLTIDGVVGPQTLEKLKLAPAEVAAELTGITDLLKVGSQGDDVKVLQAALNNNGYSLTVDGIFGSLTLNALEDFQKSNSLAVDGLAGPNTFAKLSKKVATAAKPAPTASTPAPTASTPAPTASTPAPTASTPAPTTTTTQPVDAETGASQVNDEAAFEQKISKDNSNYMIIVNKDLTFTNDLVIESGIQNGVPNRSIAACHETADGKVDKSYTITASNIVFNGPNIKFEDGIIKGDIYVRSTGFTLADATINGNIHFATEALKDAFVKDSTTKITGQVDVKAYTNSTIPDATTTTLTSGVSGSTSSSGGSKVDAVSGASKGGSESTSTSGGPGVDAVNGASQVNNEIVFQNDIVDPTSDYMLIVNRDMYFNNDLVVESGFKTGTGFTRSIAPASEDPTTKKITAEYTITAPSMVFSGLNEKVEDGIVKGDVYVENDGFSLKGATIDGNLYFATQDLMNEFTSSSATVVDAVKASGSTLNGQATVKAYTPAVDAVNGASQSTGEADFEQQITGANSNYMIVYNKNLNFTYNLLVESGYNSKTGTLSRSIAASANHYSITAPNLILCGENIKFEDGVINGNVYVENKGFTLNNETINGNLYFANQALMSAFTTTPSATQVGSTTIKGQIGVQATTPSATTVTP